VSWPGRAWRAWVELLDRREAPTSLALARIFVAAALLGDFLQARVNDLVVGVWGPPPFGLGYGALNKPPPDTIAWLGASADTAETLWLAAIGLSILLLVGLGTRVAAVLLLFVSAQLARIAPDSDRGIDILLRVALGVLALSWSHARWSLDAWLWKKLRRPLPETIPAWPRYLLFLQMVWLYFSAGQAKVDPAWGPLGHFSALGHILSDPHFARFEPGWAGGVLYPFTQLATAGTMAFELGAPLFLLATWYHVTRDRPGRVRRVCNRLRLRWVWLAVGASFHVGIAITLRLGVFPWGTLALYPVFFHPDEIAAAWRWGVARVRGAKAA
jgi:uncharacterized membrane protein YphA (DoxX/SURF4 family)